MKGNSGDRTSLFSFAESKGKMCDFHGTNEKMVITSITVNIK